MGLKPARTVDLGDLLCDITVDPTLTDVMDFTNWRRAVENIHIDGPGTLDGTATVQVSHSEEDTDVYGTTWRDLQSSGADVTIPADGSVEIKAGSWKRLRISFSGAETSNRRFRISTKEAQS